MVAETLRIRLRDYTLTIKLTKEICLDRRTKELQASLLNEKRAKQIKIGQQYLQSQRRQFYSYRVLPSQPIFVKLKFSSRPHQPQGICSNCLHVRRIQTLPIQPNPSTKYQHPRFVPTVSLHLSATTQQLCTLRPPFIPHHHCSCSIQYLIYRFPVVYMRIP